MKEIKLHKTLIRNLEHVVSLKALNILPKVELKMMRNDV
jgi:hypothetical protein